MNESINPNDLGNNITEYCQKIDINKLVKDVSREIKGQLLKSEINLLGIKIGLRTSKTRFNGSRIWFVCPMCKRRVGIIYKNPTDLLIGCRKCLNLRYKKQRYKGMIEAS